MNLKFDFKTVAILFVIVFFGATASILAIGEMHKIKMKADEKPAEKKSTDEASA